jgi:flagellar protein FlbD
MIELTTTGGAKVLLNPDLIECIERRDETVILMDSGRHYTVKEDAHAVAEMILEYQKRVRGYFTPDADIVKGAHQSSPCSKPAGEEVETGSEIGSLPD